uniref:Protein TonB n=1 Tax=Candidatus Kentrum sp. UNK TaxID=2126344 RepID=A0A451AR32_9GAMM|nr:MAG: outer membrane transport energization protein TonB [Candidatus Kentron sp. UNK]VFK73592.1 MAG: outer membrane transport energization protein TonB [Candidatus Kentron sp. UNK]
MNAPLVGKDNQTAGLPIRKIASLPIGFLVSGLLHLAIVSALILSFVEPADDPDGDAPISLTLAMFETLSEGSAPITPQAEPPIPQEEKTEKSKKDSEPVPKPEPKKTISKKTEREFEPRPAPSKVPKPVKTTARKVTESQPATHPEPAPTISPAPVKPIRSAIAAREEKNYLAMLRARIERKKYYPRASQRRGEEGKVIVRFVIRRNGEFTDLAVVRSSGIRRLDDAALKTLRRITPFEPIPAALGRGQWKLSIPLSYNLQD